MRPLSPAIALLCFSAALPFGDAAAQELRVRRGVDQPSGSILAVDAEGVSVGSDAARTLVPWDSVSLLPGDWAERAAAYTQTAEIAWRARSRLERGDLSGAEPLFERLFPAYAGSKGPTSQLVCGGLLICRLARGAQVSAVAPWMAYLTAIDGVDVRSIIRGGDVPDPADLSPIDTVTGLAPMLPPIWLSGPGVQSLARGSWPSYQGRTGLLASLYEQSARAEAQLPVSLPPRPSGDEGAEMVWDIVAARAGDASQRAAARESLRGRLEKSPTPWAASWIRTALGRSLLNEGDEESRLLGIAEIAVVPASLERVCPYLTGIALAEMALGALREGETKSALALRARLVERFPGHPALDWDPLRHWAHVETPPQPAPASPGASPP